MRRGLPLFRSAISYSTKIEAEADAAQMLDRYMSLSQFSPTARNLYNVDPSSISGVMAEVT
jgi:hypothetical protein